MTRRAVLITRGATAAILTTVTALASAGPAMAAPGFPRADGRCVDTAGVLGAALCDRITAVLRGDERTSTDEVADDGAYATGILDGLDEVRRELDHPVDESPLTALGSPQPADVQSVESRPVDARSVTGSRTLSDDEARTLLQDSDDDGGGGAEGWLIIGVGVVILVGLIASFRSSTGSAGTSGRPANRGAARHLRSDTYHRRTGSSDWGDSGGDSGGFGFGGGGSDGGGSSGSC